jgi:maltoporin
MGTDPNGSGAVFAGYNLNRALSNFNRDGSVSSGSLRRAAKFRANGQIVWNVSSNFAISAAAFYEYDDQGAFSAETLADGTVRLVGGSRNVVGAGIRPYLWVTDCLAIRGQAGWDYISRDRSVGGIAVNPDGTIRNDSFGRSGSMGIFTIAPTIKPKGGFFTRPEFRLFATYAIWSNGLRGAIGDTTYQNTNPGWLFGCQTEWFF